MTHQNQKLLQTFIQGRILSSAELRELKQLFSDNSKQEEINLWLADSWTEASADDLEISYEGLKQKVLACQARETGRYAFHGSLVRLSRYYQRIAAMLFIPLILGFSLYVFFKPASHESFYLSEAPLGQKAKIELPDGTLVWLNSGSRIRYSSGFNKSRMVELSGEAFFEVQKMKGEPFFVRTTFLDIEVTGTRFNVNAYDDEPFVNTSLVEGKVNVILKDQNQTVGMEPGKVLSWSKQTHVYSTSDLNEDATTSWKENRLIFINDDFTSLVRKIEKWYDVDVVYNEGEFKENKLTVRLLEGEQLDQLLKIIETAIGAQCTVKGSKIYITK